jgi:hypothetical protein
MKGDEHNSGAGVKLLQEPYQPPKKERDHGHNSQEAPQSG